MKNEWNLVLEEVSKQIPKVYFHPFIEPLLLEEYSDGKFLIKAPSSAVKEHVEKKYQKFIEDAVIKVYGNASSVEIFTEEQGKSIGEFIREKFKEEKFLFNPDFTFDSFQIGESNQLAYFASKEAAGSPGRINPLFLYGKCGTGKTHLLHAIGQELQKTRNENVKYISISSFLSEFVMMVQNRQSLESFRNKYQSYTSIIFDDLQFLNITAEKTQEEFYSLFNYMQERKRQIVLAADRPVLELPLQEGLRSRLLTGIQAEVRQPDSSLRKKIISLKSAECGISLSEESVELISSLFPSDTRALLGAVNELSLYKRTYNLLFLNEDKIREILESRISKSRAGDLSPDRILTEVSAYFEREKSDILSKSRRSEFILPRHISMYLIHELCEMSKSAVGKLFKTQHTTVIAAMKKLEAGMEKDENLKKKVETLRNKFLI